MIPPEFPGTAIGMTVLARPPAVRLFAPLKSIQTLGVSFRLTLPEPGDYARADVVASRTAGRCRGGTIFDCPQVLAEGGG